MIWIRIRMEICEMRSMIWIWWWICSDFDAEFADDFDGFWRLYGAWWWGEVGDVVGDDGGTI